MLTPYIIILNFLLFSSSLKVKNSINNILNIGIYDKNLKEYEGQYPLSNGMSFNSYLIIDEKILIIDTVEEKYKNEWMSNLEKGLNGRKPDYILIQHMEEVQSDTLNILIKKYPNVKIVSSIKAFNMMKNIYNEDYNDKRIVVKEGDKLSLGKHVLQFIEAPMVHWPEVMFSYDLYTNYLFSCDAFGKFGANDVDEPWEDESRRFYFGILGKYEKQVQSALNKISKFKIKMILPSHGPILTQNIDHYLSLYDKWSKYIPEEDGVVIVYSTVHGHTKIAVDKLAEKLKTLGVKYVIHNLSFSHYSYVIADAFKYSKLVLATITYHNGIYPSLRIFINQLISKNFKSRSVSIIENYSWNPNNGQVLFEKLSICQNLIITKKVISIHSSVKNEDIEHINQLAFELSKKK